MKIEIKSIMAKYPAVNDTYTSDQVLSIVNDLETAMSSGQHVEKSTKTLYSILEDACWNQYEATWLQMSGKEENKFLCKIVMPSLIKYLEQKP